MIPNQRMVGGNGGQPQKPKNVESFDILSGSSEDVESVLEICQKGGKFPGKLMADFVRRIEDKNDLNKFLARVGN